MQAKLLSLSSLLVVSLLAITAKHETAAHENVGNATAETFDAATLRALFSSVTVRENEVFAASDKGLFRASLDDKRWQRLPIGDRMPVAGEFGRVPKNSQHLFYHSLGYNYVDPKFDQGLYHSTDSGQTWRLVSNDYDFQRVYLHRDGSLYAIIVRTFKEPDKTWIRWSILRAPTLDSPLKWEDITGDIGRGVVLCDILDDPLEPELVRLRGNSLRSYIIHADDKSYRWQMTYESPEGNRNESDEAFLAPTGSASKIFYLQQATLANYFDHPFGNKTEIHALSLQTESDSLTFARDERKTVPVSIRFLKDNPTVRIVDVRHPLDCWAVRLISPAGERINKIPRGHQLVWRDSKKRAEYRTREDVISVDVSHEDPYQRLIDLDQLADFSQPGQYRLRLSYHSDWLAEDDEWSGSFSGDILTINIR